MTTSYFRDNIMERIAAAADSISMGNVVNSIYASNNWSLLPLQATYATVIPGRLMSGTYSLSVKFPSWLKHHEAKKIYAKSLDQITTKRSLIMKTSKENFELDYMQPMRALISRHLNSHENLKTLQILQHNNLER